MCEVKVFRSDAECTTDLQQISSSAHSIVKLIIL